MPSWNERGFIEFSTEIIRMRRRREWNRFLLPRPKSPFLLLHHLEIGVSDCELLPVLKSKPISIFKKNYLFYCFRRFLQPQHSWDVTCSTILFYFWELPLTCLLVRPYYASVSQTNICCLLALRCYANKIEFAHLNLTRLSKWSRPLDAIRIILLWREVRNSSLAISTELVFSWLFLLKLV